MSDVDRVYLRNILDQERTKTYSHLSADEHFEIFSAEQILKSYSLDIDDIQAGIVDGSNDGGIDSIYLLVDGKLVQEDLDIAAAQRREIPIELVVIQSKQAKGFSEEAIHKLRATVDDILDLSQPIEKAAGVYNDGLLTTIKRFRDTFLRLITHRPSLKISFYYATLADQPGTPAKNKAGGLKDRLQQLYSNAVCSFTFIEAKDLLSLYYKTQPQTVQLKTFKLFSSSQFGNAYAGLVPLREFYGFITADGKLRQDLFESGLIYLTQMLE